MRSCMASSRPSFDARSDSTSMSNLLAATLRNWSGVSLGLSIITTLCFSSRESMRALVRVVLPQPMSPVRSIISRSSTAKRSLSSASSCALLRKRKLGSGVFWKGLRLSP